MIANVLQQKHCNLFSQGEIFSHLSCEIHLLSAHLNSKEYLQLLPLHYANTITYVIQSQTQNYGNMKFQ